jgi:hypothetical protein
LTCINFLPIHHSFLNPPQSITLKNAEKSGQKG